MGILDDYRPGGRYGSTPSGSGSGGSGSGPRTSILGYVKRFGIIAISAVTLIFLWIVSGNLWEEVNADEVVLVRTLTGERIWYKAPETWAWQGGGKILVRYKKRGIIQFQPPAKDDDGKPVGADNRLTIQFNDNGRAVIRGSMNYEIPLSDTQLDAVHAAFPDQTSLENGLVRPSLGKAVFLTGTTMNSYESYKEKRSLLIQYVEDQAQNGVYRTTTVEREIEEEALDVDGKPVTRRKKVKEVEIPRDQAGQPVRTETGQMSRFNVRAFGFAVEDLDYEQAVDNQIEEQRKIDMAVQTSISNARKAIQDAVTARAQGDANIATARASREIEKTNAVVAGEQARDVARLKAEEAAAYKTEQLLRADADSEYRRRIMQADNALTQRLEAYKYGVDRIATAISQYQGQWTPNVMIGGTGQGAGQFNAVQSLIDLALVNQAKQLGLDLGTGRVSSNTTTPAVAPAGGRGAPTPERAQARR